MNWKESFYDRINTYTYITNKVVIKSILNINKNNILQIKLLQNVKYQLKTYEFISNKVVKRQQLLKIFHKLLYGFFIYSTGDSGNLPMKKLKILKHINIFNLHKKLLYF